MIDSRVEKCHDCYADGSKIMLGDRVAIVTEDKTANRNLGTIVAMLAPNTREAHGWHVPDGGFLVLIDKKGLSACPEADTGMKLISRGSDSDQAVVEIREFLQGIQYEDGIPSYKGVPPFYKYDKYLSGEEIRIGDIVETYGCGGKMQRGRIIKHFLPETKDPEARDWCMQDGGILIDFGEDRLVGYGPADEDLFFVSRGSEVRMTRTASNKIKRVSNSCLLLSLLALIILSFIDVAPWKQAFLKWMFYCSGAVFVFTSIVSVGLSITGIKQSFTKWVLSLWWLLPLLIGVFLSVVVYWMDSSMMSLWRIRIHLANCIAMCLLGHCITTICLFIRRCWRKGFISLAMLPFFLAIAFLVALILGPDIDTVIAKVSTITSIPQSEIQCLGGNLHRESRVLFRHEGNSPLTGKYEEVSPKSQAYEIVMDFLKHMNVNMDKDVSVRILKFPLEFDTVFCVICGKEQWMVFYGMSVM